MRYFLFFFLLNGFAAQAQKDTVRLVDIQSSDCKAMAELKPGFVKKENIGDTTFIDLFCSNNCAGYHNPKVELHGDSVLINIPGGSIETYFKIDGELIPEYDLWELCLENYHDSISLKVESTIKALCDCCFRFELKIKGLDIAKTYKYYYNGRYIDPDYKTTGEIKTYHFPYFLREPQYEVFEKLKKIIYKSRNEELLKELESFPLIINITADTINSSIAQVEIEYVNDIKNTEEINKKIKDYLISLSSIILVRNFPGNRWIREYVIYFGFSWETDQLELSFDAGERMTD